MKLVSRKARFWAQFCLAFDPMFFTVILSLESSVYLKAVFIFIKSFEIIEKVMVVRVFLEAVRRGTMNKGHDCVTLSDTVNVY